MLKNMRIHRKLLFKNYVRRFLYIMIAIILSFSCLASTLNTYASDEVGDENFMRIFHLDNGRKFFSVDEIKGLIDEISKDNYTHMELAIGNNGMRFLLNDMTVISGNKTYSSEEVKDAIHKGNLEYDRWYNYSPSTDELTEAEMNSIIAYAESKGIEIIPLINSPGHMNAILHMIDSLGIENAAFKSGDKVSSSTIDITNTEATSFMQDFLRKYINYFSSKGCKYFNMGGDEYALDIQTSFTGLIQKGIYYKFIDYINVIASLIKDGGMRPIAFNDGIYHNNRKPEGHVIDTDILIAYWHNGWGGEASYNCRNAQDLINDGFTLINTNNDWYHVPTLFNKEVVAINGVKNIAYNEVNTRGMPAQKRDVSGCMLCLWSDNPAYDYSEWEDHLKGWISLFSENNPEVFGLLTTPEGRSLVYNGYNQDGIEPKDYFIIEGNKSKNVGSYEAVITPAPGFAWKDNDRSKEPRKVKYTIEKATLTAAYIGETIVWNGTPSYGVKISGFKGTDNASNASGYVAPVVKKISVSPNKSYRLTPVGGAADNYNFKYVSGTLKVAAKPIIVAQGIASGKNAATISWNKVSGADRYIIYFTKCNTRFKQVKILNGKTFKWKATKLSKNTAYKFYVVAQKKNGRSYKTLASSKDGHFFTGNVRGKYTNPKNLILNKYSITLKKGKSQTIKATVSKVKKNKRLATNHTKNLRFISNNPSVAVVNASGKITAKSKGSCIIYVQAINGIWKTCKVTVK